jgi:hypothetical protein
MWLNGNQHLGQDGAYTYVESELAHLCRENFIDLAVLINDVTGTNEPPYSPPSPSEIDEIEYQRLRFWFFDNQKQFVPLLQEFYRTQVYCNYTGSNGEFIDNSELPIRYQENLLLFFYEPENLYQLAKQLGLQGGVDIWEPSEKENRDVRRVCLAIAQKMVEFDEWTDSIVFGGRHIY